MRNSLSFKFYLNRTKKKGDKVPVYLRLIFNRQKAEISTDFILTEKDWDEDKQRAKKKSTINEGLTKIENRIYEVLNELQAQENQTISVYEIKDVLTGKNKVIQTLFRYSEMFLKKVIEAGEVDKKTVSKYCNTVEYLKEFVEEKLQRKDVLLSKVNYTFLKDWDIFMLNVPVSNEAGKMERNTVNKHHSRFRTILISAVKDGVLNKNPYKDFKLKYTPSSRSFLSHDELETIINHDLGGNPSLDKVRDIFLFSVYTGLRFEDAQSLKTSQIKKNQEGNQYIEVTQEKTSEKAQIPLLQAAIAIIKKYNNEERKITGNVLPKISNQKVNTYLKVISDLTGIHKKLTHHVARHTCATTILLSNEVPLEAVSKWLGHTNIKTTQIYAKITNDYLMKLGKKLDDKIS